MHNIFEQSPAMPLELLKALVMLCKKLAAEPLQASEADAKTITTFTAVCRYWKQTFAASPASHRQLRRLFLCE